MRWNFIETPQPRVGDKKSVQKFAFLPTKCSGGWWVWLEEYVVIKKYVDRYVDWGVVDYRWETIQKFPFRGDI